LPAELGAQKRGKEKKRGKGIEIWGESFSALMGEPALCVQGE